MAESDTQTAPEDLTGTEKAALHRLQLGIEHVYRAYGHLLGFHHQVGHAMDHVAEAERRLREAGHREFADDLRDCHLPAGVVGDRWSYETVEAFRRDFLVPLSAFEAGVRDEVAGGVEHVTEREQQARWRGRARGDCWRAAGEGASGGGDGG